MPAKRKRGVKPGRGRQRACIPISAKSIASLKSSDKGSYYGNNYSDSIDSESDVDVPIPGPYTTPIIKQHKLVRDVTPKVDTGNIAPTDSDQEVRTPRPLTAHAY